MNKNLHRIKGLPDLSPKLLRNRFSLNQFRKSLVTNHVRGQGKADKSNKERIAESEKLDREYKQIGLTTPQRMNQNKKRSGSIDGN
uniref:Uncharacterized protein n=1 Tax=Noccaea caerulescens TaxID=107243 RepID=A0A1J3K445_NOCCA